MGVAAWTEFGFRYKCHFFSKAVQLRTTVNGVLILIPNFAHASTAEQFTDAIVPERFADHEGTLPNRQPVQ
jgi:hypothetical protein